LPQKLETPVCFLSMSFTVVGCCNIDVSLVQNNDISPCKTEVLDKEVWEQLTEEGSSSSDSDNESCCSLRLSGSYTEQSGYEAECASGLISSSASDNEEDDACRFLKFVPEYRLKWKYGKRQVRFAEEQNELIEYTCEEEDVGDQPEEVEEDVAQAIVDEEIAPVVNPRLRGHRRRPSQFHGCVDVKGVQSEEAEQDVAQALVDEEIAPVVNPRLRGHRRRPSQFHN